MKHVLTYLLTRIFAPFPMGFLSYSLDRNSHNLKTKISLSVVLKHIRQAEKKQTA